MSCGLDDYAGKSLQAYRRRLVLIASNLDANNPAYRDLLSELISFDRWRADHFGRCAYCRETFSAEAGRSAETGR